MELEVVGDGMVDDRDELVDRLSWSSLVDNEVVLEAIIDLVSRFHQSSPRLDGRLVILLADESL